MVVSKAEKRNLARKNAEAAKAAKKMGRDAKKVAPTSSKKKASKRN